MKNYITVRDLVRICGDVWSKTEIEVYDSVYSMERGYPPRWHGIRENLEDMSRNALEAKVISFNHCQGDNTLFILVEV